MTSMTHNQSFFLTSVVTIKLCPSLHYQPLWNAIAHVSKKERGSHCDRENIDITKMKLYKSK